VTFSFLSKETKKQQMKKFNCLTVAVRFPFLFFMYVSSYFFFGRKTKKVSHIFIFFASGSAVKSVGYYVSSETVTHARTQEKKLTQSFLFSSIFIFFFFSLFAPLLPF
jgi:hypothetical protein